MRGMLVSVLGEDYITLAEAKGLPERRIFLWYGMRNALLPQLTTLALTLGHVVSGAILVEVVFAYPGIGYQLYQAIQIEGLFRHPGHHPPALDIDRGGDVSHGPDLSADRSDGSRRSGDERHVAYTDVERLAPSASSGRRHP